MPYNITLLASIGMLANAWKAVMAVNCFQHAFSIPGINYSAPGSSPQEQGEDETDDLIASAFQAWNVIADICDYAAVDDDLCMCRNDTLDDIVQEVLPAHCSSESEEEEPAADPSPSTVTFAEAFHHIRQVHGFLTMKEGFHKELGALADVENFVLK